MTLDDLKRLIETAKWFANLGNALAAPGLVPVAISDWLSFIQASTRAEFGLSHDASVFEKAPFMGMNWLPTSNEQPDPIHGQGLDDAARRLNREGEYKAARLEAYRLALASQRKIPEVPTLKIGATDTNEAARMAGRYACRMAASEIVVDQAGCWCEIATLFHKGHWPLGQSPSGAIVTL
jgi:hypothetical protein